jgi:hypothetical protein
MSRAVIRRAASTLLRLAFTALLSLASISAALAQSSNPYYPFLAPRTVIGNPNATAGPSQSIPIANLTSQSANRQTGNYSVQTSDCGGIINITGGFFTATLPAPASFPAPCNITIMNGDTGRGKALSGFPTGAPAILYPGQSIGVAVVNGAWAAPNLPGRYKLASGQQLPL